MEMNRGIYTDEGVTAHNTSDSNADIYLYEDKVETLGNKRNSEPAKSGNTHTHTQLGKHKWACTETAHRW